MIFNDGLEFINSFSGLPKDVRINVLKHNGSITKYLADTYLNSIDIEYEKDNSIRIIYIGLKQDGLIKKIKFSPNKKLELIFLNESSSKDTVD